MTYRLHPAAAEEHLDSVAFYENRTPGLGADYLAEFEIACAESSSRRCCPLLKYHQKSASRTCSVFRSASFSELVKTRFKSWRLRISDEDLGIGWGGNDVQV